MKTIMVIAIMKVNDNDKDNGSNDENYDASGETLMTRVLVRLEVRLMWKVMMTERDEKVKQTMR